MSILKEAIEEFRFHKLPDKTLWHLRVSKAMDKITEEVLNSEEVLNIVYRNLSIHNLLMFLANCETNIMAIGNQNAWIINARTSHKGHFVGTHQVIS